MSKSIRKKLPVTIDNLKPKLTELSDYQNKIKIKIDKMANYYNKKTKILKPLTVGNFCFNHSKTNNCEFDTQPNFNSNMDKKSTRSGRTIVSISS